MASGVKAIKTRIKAAQNVGKITKAMELVSVSKMKRAVQSVLQSRSYARESWRIILELAKQTGNAHHPLLENERETKNICAVLFASDRGLCGTFHARLFERLLKFEQSLPKSATVEYVTIGRKARDFIVRTKRALIGHYGYKKTFPGPEDALPICRGFIDSFLSNHHDHVFLIYTDYESAIRQAPLVHQLLPFVHYERNGALGQVAVGDIEPHMTSSAREARTDNGYEFVFEPDARFVLSQIVPRILEMQVYHASLESSASEHAARMFSMQNASFAANEMVDSLSLAWNQARQAAITREIAEISAGKAVLES